MCRRIKKEREREGVRYVEEKKNVMSHDERPTVIWTDVRWKKEIKQRIRITADDGL